MTGAGRPDGSRSGVVGGAATLLVATGVAGAAAGGATAAFHAVAFAAALVFAAGVAGLATRGGAARAGFTGLEALGLACVAWAALAAVPLPASVVAAVAPQTAAARAAAVGDASGPWSLDAGATAVAAVGLAALVLLATAVRAVVAAGGGRALARATCVGVLLHGGAALLRGRYGEDDPLLLGWTVRRALNAWGTFPNRTQAAAYLLVGWTAAWGLVARPGRRADRALGVVTAAVAAASVVASGSRAGIVGIVAALGTLVCVRAGTARRVALGVASAALAVAAAGAAGVGPLAGALAWRANEGTRLEIWRGTLDLAQRQPVGIGWGAFPYAYPGDGRAPTDRWAAVAESDLLQGAVEFGAVGVALAALLAVAAVRALRADRRVAGPGGLPVPVALAGWVAAAPLALTGAPFHAPAVAAAGVVAWGLARGLVRGHDASGAPGYRTASTAESPWRAS